MLKLSNYTIIIPLSSPKEYLLYNTLSDTLLCLQDAENKIIGRTTWDQDDLSKDTETFQQLCNFGFLVQDKVFEPGLVRKTLWEWRFDTKLLEVGIVPTYGCNLDCSYCYQNTFDRSLTMSDTTCNQMLEWIANKLAEFRVKTLNVKFFGGEVLGRMSLLGTLCDKLSKISITAGTELNFDLTTNGTLLIPSYVKQLKSWGIDTAKITIDGDQATHDLRRPFSSGRGSFQTIIGNIIAQCNNLDIILRCNYNQHNLKAIPDLLDYLAEKKLTQYLKYIEFKPVIHKNNFALADNKHHCTHSVSSQNIDQRLWLTKEALSRGFQINTELIGGRCPAFFKSSFLIDPIGDIYKCPAFLGSKQNSIGSVQSSKLNYLNQTFLMDESWNDCIKCQFSPICCGGCRYVAQQKFGTFLNKKVCKKEHFENVGLKVLEMVHNFELEEEKVQSK